MLCNKCLEKSLNKLQQNDIMMLEYFKEHNAITPQFSFSKQTIEATTKLSIHCSAGCLLRLETLDLISMTRVSKSNKYFINQLGIKALQLMQQKVEVI